MLFSSATVVGETGVYTVVGDTGGYTVVGDTWGYAGEPVQAQVVGVDT
jgi:hypothetical protein